MEFPVVRRKVNTYGKGARKIRVHDLFDVGAASSYEITSPEQHAPAPPQARHATNILQNGDEKDPSVSTAYETHESEKPTTRTSSPRSHAADSSDLFEVDSSEDESREVQPKPVLKKRKISSIKQRQPQGDDKLKSDLKGVPLGAKGLQTLPQGERARMLKYKSANASAMAANSKLNKSPISLKRPVKPTTKSQVRGPTTTEPVASGADATSKSFRSKGLRVSSGSSADLSDTSNHSRLSQRSTPKRKRGTPDAGLASPTPSDLHLTSLRLTPGSDSQRSPISSDDERMIDVAILTPQRGRARLVDRLDPPRTQSTGNSTKSMASGHNQALKVPGQPVVGSLSAQDGRDSAKGRDVLERQSSQGSAPPQGRARATYAKQRSYLSDMVDNLDSLPGSNTQTSSQQHYSQPFSSTSVASQMQLDIEESDEPDAFNQIKSIHELRRGGAVRQSDLDVQSILEDIESPSKSLRITGLLQLAAKVSHETFLRHFQDSGSFQRLIGCIEEALDEVSAILVAFVLHSFLSAEKSSPKPLLQMLNSLYRLPVRLLSERRSLARIAKERRQNLSKLLISDITEFEGQSATTSEQTSLRADKILLSSIESAQRKLIGFGEPLPRMPQPILDEILSTLTKTGKEGWLHGQIEIVRLLLSILEIACANSGSSGSSLSALQVHGLGQAVSELMQEARQSHPNIEQSSLRLIVSMSNNDAEVCGALSEGSLIKTVFQVIDDHFLTLAGLAALEKDFENAQLDSVILAVGCLLNLAECADKARVQMLHRDAEGKSLIDRLIDIFNSHVDQTSEALTIDQTQILVAFGYISALLCTLCLNSTACKRISKEIKGDGLSQLFGAADTFLHHLQTVEEAFEGDEASANGFTTRFTTVLDTVKLRAV